MECGALKTWLKSEGVEYQDIDISVNQDEFSKITQETKQLKVPTIEIDGEYIVGFDRDKIVEKLKK